jgi:phosphoribosylformimino-5-aminoimidazole carboxamide ribotide isomerase
MKIIPAIDILGGKCVRLTQGNYDATQVYSDSPLAVARSFEDAGLKYLHLVDLDGARSGGVVNMAVLAQIAAQTSLQIDFGGGIKSDNDLAAAFDNGAAQVNVGSIAVRQPALFLHWLARYGSERIILSADCRNRLVAASGWMEKSNRDVIQYIKGYARNGVQHVVCTDIAKDGMLQGPSLPLYREIMQAADVKLIASGGICSVQDLHALKHLGCDAAIVGKAIYEGNITLKELAALC